MKEIKELNNQLERQKTVIAELQEKINLQNFDLVQLRKEIRELNEKLKCRKINMKNIRIELMHMKRTNDFTRINSVIAMLKDGLEDYEE